MHDDPILSFLIAAYMATASLLAAGVLALAVYGALTLMGGAHA